MGWGNVIFSDVRGAACDFVGAISSASSAATAPIYMATIASGISVVSSFVG